MLRFVAFLRAVNVGGHVVKMDVLKRHFEKMGFSDVETFIASGNVVRLPPARQTSSERQHDWEDGGEVRA
jgi:uncharacterized protein (DUF1697 family)